MTAVPAPPPAPAAPEHREHRGWHIPSWAAITAGVVLLVIAALGVLRAARLHRDRVDRGFGRMGDHMGNGHVHWLLWIVVILAAAAGIALLVAASRSRRAAAATAVAAPAAVTPAVGAEQILAERFARGEIDEAEFVARRGALRR